MGLGAPLRGGAAHRKHTVHSIRLILKGTYSMTVNWNWQKLITAIIAAVLGWLSSLAMPVPGQQNTTPPVVNQRLP